MDWMTVAGTLAIAAALLFALIGVRWLCSAIGRRRDQRRIEARLREDKVRIGGETVECQGCSLAQGPHSHETEMTLVFKDGASSSGDTETSGADQSGRRTS